MMMRAEALFDGIRAVVFDFDGVILESTNIKTEAFLELFADYPEHQEAILQFHLNNLGISRYVKFRYVVEELMGRPYTSQDQDELGAAFSALVLEKVLCCPFVPGARETLQAMCGQLPVFVASGTPQAELEHIVAVRELRHYFVEVWGTPHKKAEILQDILARYGWRPQQVLMIGDGMSDYQAAVTAGTRFVARETADQSWAGMEVVRVGDLRPLTQLLGLNQLLVKSV
jgi:beta-phosphoglucomutase-like phosphatase (HAD superfamily)